jgi:hypothetical protein
MGLTFWDKIRAGVGLSYTKSTQERFAAELAEDLKAQAAAVAKTEREAKRVAEAKAAVKKMATPVVTPAAKVAKAPKVEVVLKAAKATPKPKAVKLDTKAVDGDGDGLIQDGTIHERKAPAKKPAVKKATPKPKK